MKKYLLFSIVLVAFVVLAGIAIAARPDFQVAKVVNPQTNEAKNTITLPAKAIEVAPNLYYLGTAFDKGKLVEGYAILDFKEEYAKPGTECGNGICEPGENANKCPADCGGGGEETSNCYGFLSRGAKWKTLEPYLVNPANTRGLSSNYVVGNLASDIEKWETAASYDILGNGSQTSQTLEADMVTPDDDNEVYFGDVSQNGAIAITIVWGIFNGPPWQRELVEWDQVYDEIDYDWSADCLSEDCSSKMDFEGVATHELGHTMGLDDLYTDRCLEETMYGYVDFGETKKRTLEAGDITGVQELYQ